MLEILLLVLLVACLYYVIKLRITQEKLRKSQKDNTLKTSFLSKFNRELRIPLNSVNSLANTLSQSDIYLSKEEKQTLGDQILYNTNIISTLLDECLVFSHGGKGHDMENERFSPNLLCLKCIDMLRADPIKDSRVDILFKKEISDETFINSDRHLFELIVSKLIFNACKFTKEGEITVGCRKVNDHQYSIYVKDTGAGIPENRRNHVFSWFEQPEDLRNDAEIDLSIAQKLAMKVGGLLRLEDTEKGTLISFFFQETEK